MKSPSLPTLGIAHFGPVGYVHGGLEIRTMETALHLHEQGTVEADARGRITLPAGARKFAHVTRYKVFTQDDGRIVLEPMVDVPAREAWLYKNPEAHRMLEAGLASAKKKPVSLGSFAKYTDED